MENEMLGQLNNWTMKDEKKLMIEHMKNEEISNLSIEHWTIAQKNEHTKNWKTEQMKYWKVEQWKAGQFNKWTLKKTK